MTKLAKRLSSDSSYLEELLGRTADEAMAEVRQLVQCRRHRYGNIGHGRPWLVFLPLQHFLQGGNSTTA